MGRRKRANEGDHAPELIPAAPGIHPEGRWSRLRQDLAADPHWRWAAVIGTIGVALHNWWVVIYPLGWMPSWHALISEAEATDQPHGWLLSSFDIVVGLLVIVAVLLIRHHYWGRAGRVVWWFALSWAFFGMLEGIFPMACSPSTNKACEDAEWKFQLAYHHYVHMGAGVIEYFSANLVAILAWRISSLGWLSSFGKKMTIVMICAYPFMGATFFTHRWSTISEAFFFVLYSTTIGAVIWYRPASSSPDPA